MSDRKKASFTSDHQGHMQRYLLSLVLGNLRDYVVQATALPGDGNEVYRTMLNLSLAVNGYWEHAVKGSGKEAIALRKAGSVNVMINAEITNGYRHFWTDQGRHVTDHTPSRERHINVGEGVVSRAIFHPQIQLEGAKLNYNVMIADTLQQIMDHAAKNDWIDLDTRNNIRGLLEKLTTELE